MEILFIGTLLLLVAVFSDLDDIFFGLPILPASGVGLFTYGLLTFTTSSQTVILAASIAAALIVFFVYKSAKKTKTKNLNER